jgi:hypothetical protein
MRRISVALLALLAVPPAPAPAAPAPVAAFRGVGTWVDIFDDAAWKNPETTVAKLRAEGVNTLYLQTTSYRFPGPIRYPEATSRFLDAAHANGMKVVAWYVPDFHKLARDLRWSLDAARFRSATGQRFDALGMDIEVTRVRDHADRSRRLVRLSRALRNNLGPGYPLGAIIPSVLVKTASGGEIAAGYWSNFPYRGIAPYYDAFLPMAYWTYRTNSQAGTRGFISRSIDLIRQRSGRPNVPIHVIGGIADLSGPAELRGFAEAIRQGRVAGASFYDAATSGPEEWAVLRALRPALAGSPTVEAAPPPKPTVVALPRPPGAWSVDPTATRLEGGDKVTYTFPAGGAIRSVILRGYDIEPGEVVVLLNGRRMGTLSPTGAGTWGKVQRLFLLEGRARNRITFDNIANPPVGDPWGVDIRGTAAVGPR